MFFTNVEYYEESEAYVRIINTHNYKHMSGRTANNIQKKLICYADQKKHSPKNRI